LFKTAGFSGFTSTSPKYAKEDKKGIWHPPRVFDLTRQRLAAKMSTAIAGRSEDSLRGIW